MFNRVAGFFPLGLEADFLGTSVIGGREFHGDYRWLRFLCFVFSCLNG